MWIYKIDFVLLQSESCLRLRAGLMTEHLEGCYPLSKDSVKLSGIMDRQMLTYVLSII